MTKKSRTGRSFGFVTRIDRASPYRARFNPPQGGPEVSKSFLTEEEAYVWLAEHHVSVARGAFVSPTAGRTPLQVWWKIYSNEHQLALTSKATYAAYGAKYILPTFGHRQLSSLRRNEIQSWVNRLPVSPRTAETVLRILQSCLKAAVVDDLIPKSPGVGVRAPVAKRRHLVVPTAEEVEAIADKMFDRYKVAVHLAAEAGLREGEILGLRVED